MTTKERILRRIADARMPAEAYPAFDFTPQRFEDRTAEFIRQTEPAGGRAVLAEGAPLDELIRQLYPDARRIASRLAEVKSATIDPDATDDARTLCDVDLGVVEGLLAVAENGAVWIRQNIRHKALYFGATALLIVVPREAVVDTMLDAVGHPAFADADFDYGCFMSGPSKTADIEQALVFGAHGPISTTVVLR